MPDATRQGPAHAVAAKLVLHRPNVPTEPETPVEVNATLADDGETVILTIYRPGCTVGELRVNAGALICGPFLTAFAKKIEAVRSLGAVLGA